MKLIVFGASGKVGHLVVDEAIRRGHQVTAIVYKKSERHFSSAVDVREIDVHNRRQVIGCIKGHDAVLSALGSWGTATQDILSAAMASIIPAMESYSVKRIVSLTGADARVAGDRPGLSSRILRSLLVAIGPKVIDDGEQHIYLLQKSQLDWTVIRSPKMKNGAFHAYQLSQKSAKAWEIVSRRTIACAMLDLVENSTHLRQAPIIHKK